MSKISETIIIYSIEPGIVPIEIEIDRKWLSNARSNKTHWDIQDPELPVFLSECFRNHEMPERVFKLIEPIIITNIDVICDFCRYVIKQRWYKHEPMIIKNSEWAFEYASRVIKGAWPEAEKNIAKDNKASQRYVRLLNHKKFKRFLKIWKKEQSEKCPNNLNILK